MKQYRFSDDGSVGRHCELYRLEARLAVAFAVEPQRRGDPVSLASLLDALVDAPKHLLVPGGSLGEVHEGSYRRAGPRETSAGNSFGTQVERPIGRCSPSMSWLIILMAVVAAVAVVVSAWAVMTSGRSDEALERDEREISAGRQLDGLRHW